MTFDVLKKSPERVNIKEKITVSLLKNAICCSFANAVCNEHIK